MDEYIYFLYGENAENSMKSVLRTFFFSPRKLSIVVIFYKGSKGMSSIVYAPYCLRRLSLNKKISKIMDIPL